MSEKKPAYALMIVMLIFSMATAMARVGADPQPTKLFVDPQTSTVALLGDVFTIDISITNVQDLTNYEFKLGYNTTLLDALENGTVGGPFPPGSSVTVEIHEPEGYVWVSGMCAPADGSGTMAIITFKATYAFSASCTLDIYEDYLYDALSAPIDHNVEDGNYEFVILGLTVATDKPYYSGGENVTVHGNLTRDGAPHEWLVAIEIKNPANYPMVARILQTGSTPPPPGEITLVEVVPCDLLGNPKDSFRKGTLAYFGVTVSNNGTEPKYVRITVNAYDGNMVPIPGIPGTLVSVSPGVHEMHACIPIPTWVATGNGSVYACAFTDWPHNGGIPYCPEKNATFEITNGGQGGGSAPQSPEGNPGTYNLTFKLANNTMSGIYRAYASFSYVERTLTNNTVFGVDAIYVCPNHYPTIQEAVDAANSTNNSILVCPGTYDEHVIINKSVTLVGREPGNTIINGTGSGTVVTVTADNIEISGFTIKNGGGSFPDSGIVLNNSGSSTISGNMILENHNGVYLTNSSQENTIQDNIITSNNGYGINVDSSDNNDILGNTVSSNNYGIYINQSASATLRDNNIMGNNLSFGVFGDSTSDFTHNINPSNTVDGKPIIYWVYQQDKKVPSNAGYVAIVSSTNITVRNLDLTKNGQGVIFASTADSLIERVNTTNNEYGIYMFQSTRNRIIVGGVSNNTVGVYQEYSNENIICRNNFIDNTNQVVLYQSSNTWDDSIGNGNYWSDYEGEDLNGDGVGDTLLPHKDVDWYPLMNPWIPAHDVAITHVTFMLPCNETNLYPGWLINITATARNDGDFTETINVTAFFDGNPVETKVAHELFPLEETAINFTWDTYGVSPGNYTISAEASIAPNETDTADNTYIDGNVTLLIPTIHDLNVTSVRPIIPNNYSHVYSAWVINITATIKNEGHYRETPNITAHYNESVIDMKPVTLYPLTNTTLNLTWDTHGVSPGNYTISAEASIAPNETDTADNTRLNGWVYVRKFGDINGDDVRDIGDLGIMLRVYSMIPGFEGYEFWADLNGDGVLDIGDVALMLYSYSGVPGWWS